MASRYSKTSLTLASMSLAFSSFSYATETTTTNSSEPTAVIGTQQPLADAIKNKTNSTIDSLANRTLGENASSEMGQLTISGIKTKTSEVIGSVTEQTDTAATINGAKDIKESVAATKVKIDEVKEALAAKSIENNNSDLGKIALDGVKKEANSKIAEMKELVKEIPPTNEIKQATKNRVEALEEKAKEVIGTTSEKAETVRNELGVISGEAQANTSEVIDAEKVAVAAQEENDVLDKHMKEIMEQLEKFSRMKNGEAGAK